MGITETERAGLDKTLSELKLSNEECDKFSKAFKDPEFLKLFEQYAKEVADPKVKEETDLYLRQLESEGRSEEVYGKGTLLIIPTEGYVIRTKEVGTGTKVFINICSSEKLEKMRIEPKKGPDGKVGNHVEVPLTLSAKKKGQDKQGQPCWVWDFVVHPEALQAAAQKPAIRNLLAETAMEQIQGAHQVVCAKQWKELRMKYKGAEGAPTPHVLGVRTNAQPGAPPAADAPNRLRPVTSPAPSAAATPQGAGQAEGAAASATAGSAPNSGASSAGKGGARSSFSFGSPAKAAAASKASQDPGQPGYVHPGGELTPVWELVHRGQVDLAESWGDAGRGLAMQPAALHPASLVVRVQLPGIASAAAVDLDVLPQRLELHVPGKFKLSVSLPLAVKESEGKAKFDKAKQQLEVVLPTQLPPKPAPSAPPLVQDVTAASAEADAPAEAKEAQARSTAPTASETAAVTSGVSTGAVVAAVAGDAAAPIPAAAGASRDLGAGGGEAATSAGLPAANLEAQAADTGAQQQQQQQQQAGGQEAESLPEPDAAAMTENQRRWHELHQQQLDSQADAPSASTTSAPQPPVLDSQQDGALDTALCSAPHFSPSSTYQGPRPGCVFKLGAQGQGYYSDALQLQRLQQESTPTDQAVAAATAAAAAPPQGSAAAEGPASRSAQAALQALAAAGVAGPLGGMPGALPTGASAAAAPPVKLQARLRRTLAEELD